MSASSVSGIENSGQSPWHMSEKSLKAEVHRARQVASIVNKRAWNSAMSHSSNRRDSASSMISVFTSHLSHHTPRRSRTHSMQSVGSAKSERAYDKLREARLHTSDDNWVIQLRAEINRLYDSLCGPKDPQADNKLKPEQLQLLSKLYGSKQFCTLDEARAQIEVITGKPGDQSCDKDHFLIFLEKCLIHCGENAPGIVASWHKELQTTYVTRFGESVTYVSNTYRLSILFFF